MEDLDRKEMMHWPVCGNDQFVLPNDDPDSLVDAPDDTKIKCSDCQTIFTKAELIEENQEAINDSIEEIQQEAIKEIEKELKKVLRKLR